MLKDFHLRKMSADNTTPMTINTLSSSAFKNMYMIAEIIVFSITTFYFYRKINSLTYQLKEMDTKIQQLEKTIADQKTFINEKMAEMSAIVSNMLRQSRPPAYTQPPQTMYTPVQPITQPAQQHVQTVYSPVQPVQQTVYQSQPNVQPAQQYVPQPQQAQQYVPQPQRTNNTQNTQQNVQTTNVQNLQNVQNVQQTPETPPVQYVPQPPPQQQTVYTPPSPQPSTPPIVFPFELIVVGNTDNGNNGNSNSKMTIEEDDDDDLDKELSAELSELNEK
jgi:hypothetical protein